MQKLSSQDRSLLIRFASSLPKGSPEKKEILAGLQKTSTRRPQYKGKFIKLLEPLTLVWWDAASPVLRSKTMYDIRASAGDVFFVDGKLDKQGFPKGLLVIPRNKLNLDDTPKVVRAQYLVPEGTHFEFVDKAQLPMRTV